MENEEIKLIQYPVIQYRLQELGNRVTERITALNIENQVVTEDTITALKSLRADLNREAKAFETQRKAVKEAVLNPYNEFEGVYKTEIIEKYKAADELLKTKINSFEMKIKAEKRQKLIDYFNELIEHEDIAWLEFDRLNIEVGLSVSEKKYKEEILAAVGKIVEDLDLIRTETYAAEIIIEYKKTLNVSQSISSVRQRKEQERLEKQRIIMRRTDNRIDALRKIAFVKSDIANAYYHIHDHTLSVSIFDIENLDEHGWMIRFTALEEKAKSILQKQTSTTAEPLSTPTVEAITQPETEKTDEEEIFEAQFTVWGTLNELNNLKNFLVSNSYKYKNI
jgi:hypothetical protein